VTLRTVLDNRQRTFGNGILQSGASLGAIAMPLFVGFVRWLGGNWTVAFWSTGVIGFLWIPLWWIATRQSAFTDQNHEQKVNTEPVRWLPLMVRLLLLAILISCLNISWQFLRAWLPLYLTNVQNYSSVTTRLLVSGYFISTDIGCLLAGLWVAFFVKHGFSTVGARGWGFVLFAGLSTLAAIVPSVPSGVIGVICLYLAGAGVLGLHPYYYSFAQDLPKAYVGLLSGILAASAWGVASLFQIYIGKQIQETKSYETALIIVGVAPLLALIAASLTYLLPKPNQSSL
jgi:ACS family hexuronate transporter-like MFS transporter